MLETSPRTRHSPKSLNNTKKEGLLPQSTPEDPSTQLPGDDYPLHELWIPSIRGKRQLESPSRISPTLRDSNTHAERHPLTLQAPHHALTTFEDGDSDYRIATKGSFSARESSPSSIKYPFDETPTGSVPNSRDFLLIRYLELLQSPNVQNRLNLTNHTIKHST